MRILIAEDEPRAMRGLKNLITSISPDYQVVAEAADGRQALEMLHKKEIDMVVNIPRDLSAGELDNGYKIRRAAVDLNIPLVTNARLASAFIHAFCTMTIDDIAIKSWDEYK